MFHKGARQRKLSKEEKAQLFDWAKSQGWQKHQIVEILASGTTAQQLMQDFYQAKAEEAFKASVAVSADFDHKNRTSVDRVPESLSEEDLVKVRRKILKKQSVRSKATKKTTTIQLDPDQLEKLQELAEREERTVSALIRLAIRRYLEEVYE